MDLYGEELLKTGIILLIILIALVIVFAVCFIISGSKLKKKLENEYGPKTKHI